jgi:hypothetical protein
VVVPGENADRLQMTIDWINDHADDRSIELVLIVGDIGWSGGLPLAKEILDGLDPIYIPVIGDNPVQVGDEAEFEAVFGPHLDGIGAELIDFGRAPLPVYNPEHDVDSWLQNTHFEHKGVHFLTLDWGTRHIGGLLGELADLHDFEGGSWRFFEADLAALPDGPANNVVSASHHPMHTPAFDLDEMSQIAGVTAPLADRFFGNFAGHYHFNHEEHIDEGDYEVIITDATWDDEVTIRLVEVWGNGGRFEYRQELIEL